MQVKVQESGYVTGRSRKTNDPTRDRAAAEDFLKIRGTCCQRFFQLVPSTVA